MPQRFKPRYLRSGGGNVLLNSAPVWVGGGLLSAGSGAASLQLHALATSQGFNSTSTRRMTIKTAANTSALLPAGPWLCPTGLAISLSSAGGLAFATLLTSERTS